MSAFKAPPFLDCTFETSWQDSTMPTLKYRQLKATLTKLTVPTAWPVTYAWSLHACGECLYSLGAYFRMGAYTREAVVRSGHGCLIHGMPILYYPDYTVLLYSIMLSALWASGSDPECSYAPCSGGSEKYIP